MYELFPASIVAETEVFNQSLQIDMVDDDTFSGYERLGSVGEGAV